MAAPPPPELPIQRTPTPWRPMRMVIVGVAQALALVALAALLDGIRVDGFWTALLVVGVLAVLNAVLWPVVIRLALPLIMLTVGLITFVLNALFVQLADWLVDGFELSSFWMALFVAFIMSVVNIAVGGVLNVDDDHVWRQTVVRRMVKQIESVEATDVPGILFIQIDGLGHDVLQQAMAHGHAPTLAKLVAAGTHQLVPWECDLSSQTGAMQAGILLGNNSNMPAFRWYEKSTGRIMVSNRPEDAQDIEARQSSGVGLLVGGGASRANVFSGDAEDSMFTFSTVLDKSHRNNRFVYAIATPYALLRIVALMIVDIFRERRAARVAKRQGVEPRMHRGGVYPLLRAATTVVMAEITYAILIGDVERGAPSAYADLVGYDEVAHHSGIMAPESLDTLRRVDDQLRRLLTTLEEAPRPYHVVFLSDHGQTQGASYEQRYGETIDETVQRLADGARVAAPILAEEGWNNLNGLLTDAIADEGALATTVRATTKGRTDDGEVKLGPQTETDVEADDNLVVLASGNLGLLSFRDIEGRATRQQMTEAYPGLLLGLAKHEGIGFVAVRDEELGDIAIGGSGIHYLDHDRVEGEDPLEVFGPNAADHLRRTCSFENCPDVLINGFYDPVTDEGAALEDQIGFHGGMGGKQSHPFVLAPTALADPDEPLVGAQAIHRWFKGWIEAVQGTG